MIKFTTLLFLLLAVGAISAQTPELGLLPPQVYIHKQITSKGPMSMNAIMEAAKKRNARDEPEIVGFTDPLEAKIALLVPRWLKALGTKELAILDLESMTEAEKEDYLQFHVLCTTYQSLNRGGMNLGRKALEEKTTVYLKDDSNKLADELDRDYLLLIDVYGYHSVSKRKSGDKVDPKNLKGNTTLVVSIFDAATGISEVTKVKSTEGRNPSKISAEAILKDLKSLVEKTYEKFSKRE